MDWRTLLIAQWHLCVRFQLIVTVQADCSKVECPSGCTGNHGVCTYALPTPYCTCNAGWSDASCSTGVCIGGCPTNAYCEELLNPPACKCNAGFSGANCETGIFIFTSILHLRYVAVVSNEFCPGNCSNQGSCDVSTSTCSCNIDQGA